jgi:(5-formylfuran-3-yl)methyl phosphate synthase
MTALLVSVRSPQEAEIALSGGAAVIDVKEPARGPLGRADDAVIAAVVGVVAKRRPVSAALGELTDGATAPAGAQLAFVKWGLAGSTRHDWRQLLTNRVGLPGPRAVIVAYADWQCAAAPPIGDVVSFACERPGNVLLIDTHCKDAAPPSLRRRPTLLDWFSADDVIATCRRCHAAGVRIALAGSLGLAEIETLLAAEPDWFAVRGAACEDNERGGAIQFDKVCALVELITQARHTQATSVD